MTRRSLIGGFIGLLAGSLVGPAEAAPKITSRTEVPPLMAYETWEGKPGGFRSYEVTRTIIPNTGNLTVNGKPYEGYIDVDYTNGALIVAVEEHDKIELICETDGKRYDRFGDYATRRATSSTPPRSLPDEETRNFYGHP